MSLFGRLFGRKSEKTRTSKEITSKERLRAEALYLADQGFNLCRQGQSREALRSYEAALTILREIGERAEEGTILNNIGAVCHTSVQPEEALYYYNQALAVCREMGDQAGEATTLTNIGIVYHTSGRPLLALQYYTEALPIARKVRDRDREAWTLSKMGEAYGDLRQPQEMLCCHEEALTILRESRDWVRVGTMLGSIGKVYNDLGQSQEALRCYDEARAIWREEGDQTEEVDMLNKMAIVYYRLNQHREGLRCYNEALGISQQGGDLIGQATALYGMASMYEDLNRFHEALNHYKHALALWKQLGIQSLVGTTLTEIGDVCWKLGQFKEALSRYEDSLVIQQGLGDRRGEGHALCGIGTVYCVSGYPQEALRFCGDAIVIAREVEDRALEASALNNLAAAYDALGQHRESLRYCRQALTISRELGDRAMEGGTLTNIGEQYHDLRQLQEALQYYEEALLILREVDSRRGQGVTLNNMGEVYRDLGQPQEALRYFEQSLTILREIGARAGEGSTLTNIGSLYTELGQPSKALSFYENALAIMLEVGDRAMEGMLLGNIGKVYYDIADIHTSCQYLERACRVFESIRYEVLSDEARASFFEKVQYDFQNYVRALMRWHQTDATDGHAAQAFHIWERGRARALLDLLAESRGGLRQDVDAAMAKQKEDLLGDLAFAQNRLMQPELSEQERRQWLARRDEINRQLGQLEAKIRAANPHYAAYVRPEPLTLQQAQEQLLDEKTALLEYALSAESSFLWVVTKDDWEVCFLPSAAEIREKAAAFFEAFLGRTEDYAQAAYDLYLLLIQPAGEFIEGKRLIVVPDDVLHFLPFETFLTEPVKEIEKRGNGEMGETEEWRSSRLAVVRKVERPQASQEASGLPYLLHRHSIVYAPSATALATVKRERAAAGRRTWEKEFIGFAPVEFHSANALPHTAREVNGIAGLFPGNKATVRVRGSASRRAAQLPDLKQHRYVHYATHGHADADKPQFCGLLFPDDEGDVLLHTFEIFNLELDADLVVASACVTGLGKQVRGEGMMGLMRAFFYAGAPSVCVSLWSVADESTADLMQKFYRRLISGEVDKAEALRQAKLEMIQEERWTHPYHWAPFVLVGDWQ